MSLDMTSKGFCVWFTGLPCSGKTTLSALLARKLSELGRNVILLDGDAVRTYISSGLGFSKEDRITNNLRVGRIALEHIKNNSIVICALVSPYESARKLVRDMIGEDRFMLVYLNTPREICEKRDTKGMYAKARRGEIKGFTGVDDPYEPPLYADLVFDTSLTSPEDIIMRILDYLALKDFIFDPLSRVDIRDIIGIAKEAGERILEVYRTSFTIKNKIDNSPLTTADYLSHEIISKRLKNIYPAIPVLSEEGKGISYEVRKNWQYFWLIDPLDGTKEFIKRNGEFTVNIALINRHKPVLGVIYAPAKNILYFAKRGKGAFKLVADGNTQNIRLNGKSDDKGLRAVVSRSHSNQELEEYLNKLNIKERISTGSSLKFCLVAEGKADIYPRIGTTMEWDTAAGQIIVEEAGGKVVEFATGNPLTYNKKSLKNPSFIVIGQILFNVPLSTPS